MPKRRYKFNPVTLNYERIGLSIKERLTKFVAYFSSSLGLSIFLVVVLLNYYETPKTKALRQENQKLLTQYELMNKDLDRIGSVLDELQQRDDNLYRVIFEAEPIPSSIRKAGFGGANKYAHLESFDNADLIINTAKKLDILAKESYIQSKSYDKVRELAMSKEKMLASIPAIMPIFNNDLKRTASGWGIRIHPIYKIRKFHYGMDFTAPVGTDIYSTGDGVVREIESTRSGFGNVLVIDHGFGYETLYGHLSRTLVKPGQIVKRGDVIAKVGNTGTSNGPHLHYEVHKNGEPVNPQYYYFKDLSPEEYEKLVALSSNSGQSFD
jgi:murein DD-endopeptidase MepM/ murein hydrolase activator NlpD